MLFPRMELSETILTLADFKEMFQDMSHALNSKHQFYALKTLCFASIGDDQDGSII